MTRGCMTMTCELLTLDKCVNINNVIVKLDFSLDCKTDNCIYNLTVCKHCTLIEFYFGQTVTAAHLISGLMGIVIVLNLNIFNKHPEHFF